MGAGAREIWAGLLVTKVRLVNQTLKDINELTQYIKEDLEKERGCE